MSVWEQGGRPSLTLAFEDWATLPPAAPPPLCHVGKGKSTHPTLSEHLTFSAPSSALSGLAALTV